MQLAPRPRNLRLQSVEGDVGVPRTGPSVLVSFFFLKKKERIEVNGPKLQLVIYFL